MNPVEESPLLPSNTGQGPHTAWSENMLQQLRRIFLQYGFRLNRVMPLDASEVSRMAGSTVSPATITASQNSYDPGDAQVVRLDADALGPWSITGLKRKADGEFRWLLNVSANTINITHQDAATTTAEDRIILKTTPGPFALAQDQATLVWYDAVTNRWRQLL